MRVVLIGNPENRRVEFFQQALTRFQHPPAQVLSWLKLLRHQESLDRMLQPGTVLRIESPGENFDVEKLLLELGAQEPDAEGDPPRMSLRTIRDLPYEQGRILYPRQWYLGFCRILRKIQETLAAFPDIRMMHAPADIEVMFDKRRCHRRCLDHKIPVPPQLDHVTSFDNLLEKMNASGFKRVFVKLANGSSASGVVALETNGPHIQAHTSVELLRTRRGIRLYNSLKIRRYRTWEEIGEIINALCREGAHVERWIPKAGWQGRRCDMRIVTIGGEAQHAVLRLSKSPMTNLHLGNRRGDLQEFLAHFGEERWAQTTAMCRRAAALFSTSVHTGLDVLFSPDLKRHIIAEINAFGDLLPNVLYKGLNTYEAQVVWLMSTP